MNGKNILITGGTGSFGQRFVNTVLADYKPSSLIVLSRDELKQFEMSRLYPEVKFILGDIRDKPRLVESFKGINYIVHAAALKQVPMLESNPQEAIKTNVLGTQNVIEAAIENNVERVIALSTDKACNPVNLYGATKLCMEKLLLSANAQQTGTLFSAVRYGNVFGSRGSVVETFLKQVKEQFQMYGSGVHPVLTITDKDMTRFWITLSKGVDFVISRLIDTSGGKIYIPKLPTVKVFDLAKAIACNCTFNIIGIRPGEKLHEVMVSKDEIVRATDINDYISISAELSHKPLKAEYNSGTNKQILTQEEIALMLSTYETEKEYSK